MLTNSFSINNILIELYLKGKEELYLSVLDKNTLEEGVTIHTNLSE